MTTQYAVLPARSGRTLTAKLFTLAAPDTVAFTADTVAERTNAKGEYLCTFGEASVISGRHKLVLFYGSIAAAIGYVTFAGTDGETATETPVTVELDTVRQQALADLAAMITGSGTGDAKFDAMALSLAPSGSSSGDWTDGEKAQIRYRLAIDGTATAPTEPEAEPIVVTPATGIMTTGWLVTRVNGVPTAGIKIYYQHVQEPTADRGSSYDDTIYSSTSNSEGIAELSLVKGGLYYIWRSSATRPKDCIAYRVLKADGTAPDSTLELPSHIGHGSAA